MAISYGGDSVNFADGSTLASGRMGMVNRIINGDMRIAQRGTGTTTSAFVNQVDQFQVATNAMSFTFGQSSSAPAGFTKSLLVTNTSAVTPSGAQYYSVRNMIEGLNMSDLAWGTANAKPVTLSFWVNSSVAGTFGGAILNGSSVNYCYPFTYSIPVANTWTQAVVNIPAPTSGTWATDNNAGIMLEFSLGCGSNYSGTAGAWTASRVQAATGQTQWSATNGATFYLTGVDLRAGTYATAPTWEFRSYQQELALCQRYYQRYGGDGNGSTPVSIGSVWSSGAFFGDIQHKVKFRASPSATSSTTTCVLIYVNGSASPCTNINITNMNTDTTEVVANQTGMTPAQAGFMRFNAPSDWIGLSAEL